LSADAEKEILVAVASLVQLRRTLLLHHSCTMLPCAVHSRVDRVENIFSLGLVESRLSHRLEMLFSSTFVGMK